jgi:hypothetical protein
MRRTMTEIEKAKRVAELLKQVKEENPDLSAEELRVQGVAGANCSGWR